jgi:dTDP-4-amino-4,6-dideoxygalactose transaminase
MKNIIFNIPSITNIKNFNIKKAFNTNNFIGNSYFHNKCVNLIKKKFKAKYIFLTNNCTSAIEAALLSLNLKRRDEVIIQSYTFVSIVDILYKLGIKFKFCDIDKNFVLDLNELKKKINKNTKVIILTHYNGNSIDFLKFKKIIKNKNITIIEDAAQVYGAKYKNLYLGSIGDFGAFSFHQTKNIHCGSGGALILNNKKYYKNLVRILDRGTNKSDFIKKKTNKYTWISKGVSSTLTEMQSVFLYSQLKKEKLILNKRKKFFYLYKKYIKTNKKYYDKSDINKYNQSNFHMFYIKLKNLSTRDHLKKYLKKFKIETTSHYEPLHLSTIIKKNTKEKNEKLKNTEKYAKSILRLPLHLSLNEKDIKFISFKINNFFTKN